jgi:hypothetical protein
MWRNESAECAGSHILVASANLQFAIVNLQFAILAVFAWR